MRVVIAGDLWPQPIGERELRCRLGLAGQPDVFVLTVDAAMRQGPDRPLHSLFPFDESALRSYALGRQNVAVVAANHVGDFGEGGVRGTIEAVRHAGFVSVGAGDNAELAAEPLRLETLAGPVSVLAYAETAPRVAAVAAGQHTAGCNPYELERVLADIRAERMRSRWVWVVLHWGQEFVRFPDPTQRSDARAMVSAGAQLVWATHTHVPLGFERFGDGHIFYGLGNFFYPPYRTREGYWYRWHPMGKVGLLLEGEVDGSSANWRVKTIAHDGDGKPSLRQRSACPDYARAWPPGETEYPQYFRVRKTADRIIHMGQRLAFMTLEERRYRLRQMLKRFRGGR